VRRYGVLCRPRRDEGGVKEGGGGGREGVLGEVREGGEWVALVEGGDR